MLKRNAQALWPNALQYGGHCEGASELRLWPGVRGIRGGNYIADTHTAGSCTLLLQAALPCALLGQLAEGVQLTLRGGTDVMASPSVEYVRMVLIPMLEKMGVPSGGIALDVTRRGFYPQVSAWTAWN